MERLPLSTSGVITTLSWDYAYGPESPLAMDSAGNIYCAEVAGGLNSFGAVFSLTKTGGAGNLFDSFNVPSAGAPNSGIIMDSAGNIYGTTGRYGAFGNTWVGGTVYELPKGGNTPTTLVTFNGDDGNDPGGLILDAAGNLYGDTLSVGKTGTQSYGTIFEIAKGSGTITTLATFNGTNGSSAVGLTLDSSGNLFGTTFQGGSSGNGTVFEIVKGSGTITVLANFNGANGSGPQAGPTLDAAGNLYGTTSSGGVAGDGTVFELVKGATQITPLVSFNGADGKSPDGALLLDAAGNIFGTTSEGGAYGGTPGDGTVLEIAHGTNTITTLASFDGSAGAYPTGPLTVDAAGNLYGVAGETVFEFSRGPNLIVPLAALEPAEGNRPAGGVVLDPAGNLYGAAMYGGINGNGSVFEVSPLPVANSVGAAANQTIRLVRDSDNQHIDWIAASIAGSVALNDSAGLTVTSAGGNNIIILDNLNGSPLPGLVHLNGSFTLTGLQTLNGTTLDVGSNTIYFNYGEYADPLAIVRQALSNGSAGGTWAGGATPSTGAITSSAAAQSARFALGYADASTYDGANPVFGTIKLVPTIFGDTNLDGSVNLSDLLTLTRNFGKGTNWDQGDFNYDSSVNLSDFLALTRNFGKTLVVNPLNVTSTADDGSLGTLRYAIAHSLRGDTITFDPTIFAPGTSHTITLNGLQLEISHNLTIQGPGSANLSISGNNVSRIFQVFVGTTANVSGLTLTAGNAGPAYGGAINNSGILNLANCSITSSTATDGGGLYSISGAANVTSCTFSNDTASAYGGALFNDAQATSTVTGCTFLSNSAGHGGALLDYGTALILINDTITQNSSTGSGGGINNVAGNLIVSNCTILNNTTGSSGGGIFNGQTATINNSIVAENTTTSASPTDLAGNSFSGSNNLIGDGSGGLSSSNHNLLGSTSSLLNPKLGSLSNNGGPTLTFMPLSGSPVIDAGSNALIPTGISTDQRGYGRIFNGTVDIGAVEFGSALAPTLSSASQQQPTSTTARRRV